MLIRAPERWPQPLVAVVAMVLLAVLDLLGAFAAKEAVLRRSPGYAALGAVLFVLLFYVYACSLQYAELALVTFGWIVVLQVGVLVLDRLRYGVQLPVGKWVAVLVILMAQGYLLFAPAAPTASAEDHPGQGLVDVSQPGLPVGVEPGQWQAAERLQEGRGQVQGIDL
jgi:hypothetical protein